MLKSNPNTWKEIRRGFRPMGNGMDIRDDQLSEIAMKHRGFAASIHATSFGFACCISDWGAATSYIGEGRTEKAAIKNLRLWKRERATV